MNAEVFLLDSSAIMTYLEDEEGAEYVNTLLFNEIVLMPWSAMMEVYYLTLQEQGVNIAEQRYEWLKKLPVTILWEMDEATLLIAARFKAMHRISFADALIAGFAAAHNAILVHKDPEYQALKGKIQLEPLPYKS
ncbi:MAG TPA: PIN domain-containing protein [Anaerolineae bacterium]|nr:PIN domain-containing protein [Anaerolineae bacterium]HQI85222.1 PIN domain-containing protein [Anaerolineae bacterium]